MPAAVPGADPMTTLRPVAGEVAIAVGREDAGVDVAIAVTPERVVIAIAPERVVVDVVIREGPEQRADPAVAAIAVPPPSLAAAAVTPPCGGRGRCNLRAGGGVDERRPVGAARQTLRVQCVSYAA